VLSAVQRLAEDARPSGRRDSLTKPGLIHGEGVIPLHVVCAWIGNSQPVAMKHYLQVTDDHFRQAVQNPVQQVRAAKRTANHKTAMALGRT